MAEINYMYYYSPFCRYSFSISYTRCYDHIWNNSKASAITTGMAISNRLDCSIYFNGNSILSSLDYRVFSACNSFHL